MQMEFVKGAVVTFPAAVKVANVTIPSGAVGIIDQVFEQSDELLIKFDHGHKEDIWKNLGVVRVPNAKVELRSVPVDQTAKYQKFSFEKTATRNKSKLE